MDVVFAKVAEDMGKLGKGLTKQDHIIVVRRPGNNLERNCHYSIENDAKFIAERISNVVWDLSTSLRGMTSHG
jgi:hypothetical protein